MVVSGTVAEAFNLSGISIRRMPFPFNAARRAAKSSPATGVTVNASATRTGTMNTDCFIPRKTIPFSRSTNFKSYCLRLTKLYLKNG